MSAAVTAAVDYARLRADELSARLPWPSGWRVRPTIFVGREHTSPPGHLELAVYNALGNRLLRATIPLSVLCDESADFDSICSSKWGALNREASLADVVRDFDDFRVRGTQMRSVPYPEYEAT